MSAPAVNMVGTTGLKCEVCQQVFKTDQMVILKLSNSPTTTLMCKPCSEKYISQVKYGVPLPDGTTKEFKCKSCKDIFNTDQMVVLKHSNSVTSLMCTPCSKRYISQNKSRIALPEVSTIEYKCNTCDKVFNIDQMCIHKLDNSVTVLMCTPCKKKYLNQNIYNVPLPIVTTEEWKCNNCNKVFSIDKMVIHKLSNAVAVLICKPCKKIYTIQNKSHISHLQVLRKEKEFKCDACDKMFYIDQMVKCNSSHSNKTLVCISCNEKCVNENTFDVTLPEVLTKEYKCHQCEKIFAKARHLAKHVKGHTLQKTFTCEICNKKYKRKHELTSHKKVVHASSKDYVCNACGYATAYKNSFETHLQRHAGLTKYTCEVCGKGCYTSSELESHKAVHAGQKYQCEVCGKAFVHKHNMLSHQRKHNPENDMKQYQCETCGKSYRQKSKLKSHMLFHTGETQCVCDICGKSLTSSKSLKIHRRLHTGEKPYSCDVCSKTFNSSSNLRVHERSHTGAKPYSCEQCNKVFSQRTTLVIHMRLHTGERPFECQICGKSFVTKTLLNYHQKNHS